MSTSQTVALAVALTAVLSATVTTFLTDSPARAADGPAVTLPPRPLDADVERIAARQADILAALEDVQMQLAGNVGSGRVSMGDVELAVRRYMESAEHAAATDSPAAVDADSPAGLPSGEELLAMLTDDELGPAERQRLWQRLSAEGRTEEAIAMFEARAEADPNNPDKRVELGQAYLQQIQEVGNGPLAGVLATKADGAFDAALEIDARHWEARFNKAVALTFWPPVFGKQPAAIQQFETLVQQQAQVAPDDNHAQTHLLLGNMYQQLGEHGKAVAAWQAGLVVFPNHEGLLQQLALATGD